MIEGSKGPFWPDVLASSSKQVLIFVALVAGNRATRTTAVRITQIFFKRRNLGDQLSRPSEADGSMMLVFSLTWL
jgi:hypothetical protein